jgi:cell division septal protein FtsQ
LKKVFVGTAFLLVFSGAAVAEDKKPAPAPQVLPLTPLGKLAYKTVAQELQQLQQDMSDLMAAEIKAQGLTPGEWQLNIYNGTLVKVTAPVQAPPAAKPAPVPAPAEKK